MKEVVKCNRCGEYADVDTSAVLTSLPPQYNAHCSHCGNNFYCLTSEVECIQACEEIFGKKQLIDRAILVRQNYDKVINSLYRALYTEESLTDDELKLIIDYVMEEYK